MIFCLVPIFCRLLPLLLFEFDLDAVCLGHTSLPRFERFDKMHAPFQLAFNMQVNQAYY